jgi:hypothetical protein
MLIINAPEYCRNECEFRLPNENGLPNCPAANLQREMETIDDIETQVFVTATEVVHELGKVLAAIQGAMIANNLNDGDDNRLLRQVETTMHDCAAREQADGPSSASYILEEDRLLMDDWDKEKLKLVKVLNEAVVSIRRAADISREQ